MAVASLRNRFRIKRLRTIYILYWFLLTYIIAALVFWFIALDTQNKALSRYRLDMIDVDDESHDLKEKMIKESSNRKTAQYIGEGVTFFLLIVAGAVLVFRAITKQLNQSQQLQHFMMAITHELKTPIAVTKLNLETLQKRLLSPEKQRMLISSTIQEADRLNALCNNMLLTSQIEAGGYSIIKEQIDLVELANECVQDFIRRYPNRKIETSMPSHAFISGDRILLQLSVNNLLDNAIKYSSKDDIVLLRVDQQGAFVNMQVIDEGRGVLPGEKIKIFEKFFRGTGRQTKGTGLGLYLTKRIIEQHKGNITVACNVPRGSIFEINFPALKK